MISEPFELYLENPWESLHDFIWLISHQATQVQEHLLTIQPNFKSNLLAGVEQFIKDSNEFVGSYDTRSVLKLFVYGIMLYVLRFFFVALIYGIFVHKLSWSKYYSFTFCL